MVAIEERILKLSPHLSSLNKKAKAFQLEFPGVTATQLKPSSSKKSDLYETYLLQVGPRSGTELWKDFFDQLEDLTEARFYLIDGSFPDGLNGFFHSLVGFEGLGRTKAGEMISISGKQTIVWKDLEIQDWIQKDLKVQKRLRPIFRDVTDDALPDTADYQRAIESRQEKNIIDLFTKNKFTVTKQLYADYLDLDSTFQHPGLSVVDYNQDGWDDLYVMGRWGKNQLLHNNGDGTFKDVAPQVGLDLDGMCTSAIFADFDNDGDPDVFIGRSLERSLYLRNEKGRYVNRTREAFGKMPLPYLVSTISAVDYDQDGLLDVYFGLYAPPQAKHPISKWAHQFFPKAMAEEIIKREPSSHSYLSRLGPPNLLVKNLGRGRFATAPEAEELAEWHDTHQTIWADFDDDGDPDVYVCNDFAPDHLYQNNGPQADGKPRFVDISTKEMQGFGMGASFGDYDRDGRLDLYVTNMFSKAGRRITDTIDGLDPRVPYSAQGNLLFRNTNDGLVEVAQNLKVHKVGWAYGAQFVDIDNDGWLDLYSASGFYTAPEEIATTKDL